MKSLLLVATLIACAEPRAEKLRNPPSRKTQPPEDPAYTQAPVCPLPAGPRDPVTAFAEPRDRVATSANTCEVADTNIARVERAIAEPHSDAPAAKSRPWDHRTPPKDLELIARRFALTPAELALLAKTGFVVPARLESPSWGTAFHELYQSELPLYVSVDAVLDAIYAGNDSLIADLEDARLAPELGELIDGLACTLAAHPELPPDTRRDLDVYLTVARALARATPAESIRGELAVTAEAKELVASATAAAAMTTVSLFGRDRVIDFTQFAPRGHYAGNPKLEHYFRAAMWLSRIEFNLVSRSSRSSQPGNVPDRTETPREEVDALALAQLVGPSPQLADLELAWSLAAGVREDVSIPELLAFHVEPTDPRAPEKLRAAIGDRWQRTARLHYMPQGSPNLPAIATLLGPRVVPGALATRPLVHDELPNRRILRATDFAFVLGHDRARDHLTADLQRFPELARQLPIARTAMANARRGDADLYSAWLDAIRGLATRSPGALPSFTTTDAYADLRINSAVAAYGQLSHNYVLMAGESYSAGGCTIPDGYVEPALATYAQLLAYTTRGLHAFMRLDPHDDLGGIRYFARLGTILKTLTQIQQDELADRPLSADERAFLSMVSEPVAATTGSSPTYTGWWFDMFRRRIDEGLGAPDFIASVFTGDLVTYLGATLPRFGVFVIDTGGAPRAVVGPVARAYEYTTLAGRRLDDVAARDLGESGRVAPWEASYTVGPAPPAPKLRLQWSPGTGPTIATRTALGPVTLELFDHHRKPLAKRTQTVGAGTTTFALPTAARAEGIHLAVGGFHGWYELGLVERSVDEFVGGYVEAVP